MSVQFEAVLDGDQVASACLGEDAEAGLAERVSVRHIRR